MFMKMYLISEEDQSGRQLRLGMREEKGKEGKREKVLRAESWAYISVLEPVVQPILAQTHWSGSIDYSSIQSSIAGIAKALYPAHCLHGNHSGAFRIATPDMYPNHLHLKSDVRIKSKTLAGKAAGFGPRAEQPNIMRLVAIASFLGSFIAAGLLAIYLLRQGFVLLADEDLNYRPRSLMSFDYAETDRRALSGFPHKAFYQKKEPLAELTHKSRLNRAEFAAAIPTDSRHSDYVTFSRAWRQGVDTYVASNELLDPQKSWTMHTEHQETWNAYPDDQPLHTLALKGDSRAALAPFLAARNLTGKFKWMLYGDDDTFFFMDAVAHVVRDLDPEMPYFLSDHMWWTAKWKEADGSVGQETHHPHKEAPLCVPCNYKKNTSGLEFPSPRGCPCTPADLCHADHKGALLSVGLLKSIPFQKFEDCIITTYTTGGDAAISICLWQMGYGMTSPDPLWHPEGLSMFDISGEAQGDGDDIIGRVAKPFSNLIQAAAGLCRTGTCKLELENFVTLHMRSRKFPSKRCFAEIARALANLGHYAYGREAYIPFTRNSTLAASYRQSDQELRLAILLYKHDRICKDRSNGTQENAFHKRCLKDLFHVELADPTDVPQTFYEALQKAGPGDGAQHVAEAYIRLMFTRYPSPTGTYGFIPQGREK